MSHDSCATPLRPQAFTRMLHVIPLTVVESRKEVDDVKELISICKEYHIALRCELKRKVRVSRVGWGHGWLAGWWKGVAGEGWLPKLPGGQEPAG